MSGGKGGSTTSAVKIPEYIESASKQNLARANEIAQLGYVPYYGPDVAAFSPMQEQAFGGTQQAASAFGMPGGVGSAPVTGMGAPTEYAGGVRGYSSAPMYQQSLDALAQNAPAQYDFIRGMFINPMSGQRPNAPFSQGGTIYESLPEDERQDVNTPFVVKRRAPPNAATGGKGGGQQETLSDAQTSQAEIDLAAKTAISNAARNKRIGLTPEMEARGITAADLMG